MFRLGHIFIFLDVLLFIGTTLLANEIRFQEIPNDSYFFLVTFFMLLMALCSNYVMGNYDDRILIQTRQRQISMLASLIITTSSIIVINYFFSLERDGNFGRGVLLGSIGTFYLIGYAGRSLAFRFMATIRSKQNYLFLVSAEAEKPLRHDIASLGFDSQPHVVLLDPAAIDSTLEKLDRKWAQIVVVTNKNAIPAPLTNKLIDMKLKGQPLTSLNMFYENMWKKIPFSTLNEDIFIDTDGFSAIYQPITLRVKRLADLAIAIPMTLLVSPLMLLIALAIKTDSPGPALYYQTRTGFHRRTFRVIKFRSMSVDAEAQGAQWAQKEDKRITRVGKFLRKSRLDELPQLWNIIKGEMSFVGPRPERPEFDAVLEKEIPYYALRYSMAPGLTGWAQVMYPYGASMEDSRAKLEYELYYAKNYNLLFDLKIILKTVRIVILGRGR